MRHCTRITDRTQDPKTCTLADQHPKLTQDTQWHPRAIHFTVNQIPTSGHCTALLMPLHWLAPHWLYQGLWHPAHMEAATWRHLNWGILIYDFTDSYPENLVSAPQCRFLLIFECPKNTWASRQEGHKSPTELVLYLLVLPRYLEYL